MKKGRLVLKDGTSYEGLIFGAEKSTAGEVVFSTGMVGYPESLTDPSFEGQILTFTYPLIGNYGVPSEKLDKHKISRVFESDRIHAKGLIVGEYSQTYNHWDAAKSLSDWLKEQGITGITGIDTRALTQLLRDKGSQLGKILVEEKDVPQYNPNTYNIVEEVSLRRPKTYKAGTKRIIMIDCGVKNNTIRHFLNRNVTVIRVPWDYDYFAAKEKFNGVFISNGPGNPEMCKKTISLIKKGFEKKIPTFGICLGNQLMGLAAGAKTYKLRYGNRGQNQPCVDLETGRCYITSQNHGFAINPKTLPKDWKVWFQNANDKTVEGIKHTRLPFFSVQFHPEAAPGPLDTEYLFDKFVKIL
jgi:carbamoyl-phosphate synthase small subunit